MLYFITVWIVLLAVCCCIGTAVLNQFQVAGFEQVGDRFMVAEWLGVVILSIALLATSLVLPLSPTVGAAVAVSLVALSLRSQQTRIELDFLRARLSKKLVFTFLGLAIAVAAFTAQPVTWLDAGLYHYGVIQWLAKFGAVPGIALLFGNLGFTSSWFALAAPLNAEILDARVSAVTNGFVLLMGWLQLLISLGNVTHRACLSNWFIIAFLSMILPIAMGTKFLSEISTSPSPDLPTIFLVGIVAWTILLIGDRKSSVINHQQTSFNPAIVPLILSAGAVTIKLIAIPLFLIAGLLFVFSKKLDAQHILSILLGSVVAILLLFPMFISGIITSGCPLYPSAFSCLDLPWSPTAENAQHVANNTYRWVSRYDSSASGMSAWLVGFKYWISSSNLNKVIALLVVIAISAIFCVFKLVKIDPIHKQFWVAAIGLIGVSFILMTSPLLRFILSYITILIALAIALLIYDKPTLSRCSKYKNILSRFVIYLPLISRFKNIRSRSDLLLPFLAFLVAGYYIHSDYVDRILLPPPLKSAHVIQRYTNDITYFSPQHDQCWATKIPCAFTVSPDVRLRDPARGIQGGFVRQQ